MAKPIECDVEDVFGLYHTSHRSFYFEQIDRFEGIGDKPKVFTQDKKLFMYWMEGYASVFLFTKILNAFGYETFVLNDLAKEEVNEYTVLTDFAGNNKSWWEVSDG